jgi:hypothetical protein
MYVYLQVKLVIASAFSSLKHFSLEEVSNLEDVTDLSFVYTVLIIFKGTASTMLT